MNIVNQENEQNVLKSINFLVRNQIENWEKKYDFSAFTDKYENW